MRVDKFLWFARLTKTRGLAQNAIAAGQIRIDRERVGSNHKEVKPGQTVTLALNNRVRVLRIETLPVRRGPAPEAQACYCELAAPQVIDGPEVNDGPEVIDGSARRL